MTVLPRLLLALALALAPAGALAQGAPAADRQTLEDLRAELTAFGQVVAQLRAQLTGGAGQRPIQGGGADALQRLDILEEELRRLTGQVEQLQNDVRRMADDGGRRYGDLEFRLTELEGGDVSLLGDNEPLGGGLTPPPGSEPTTEPAFPAGAQVAATEQNAFDDARRLLEGGDRAAAADAFRRFLSDFPDGPLTFEARYWLAEAQFAQNDWDGAARNYLESFSGSPAGPQASDALLKLGIALGRLGQFDEACLTLDETLRRFPEEEEGYIAAVLTEKQDLGCP
ncbi:MAG: tol-pal system protein YbgF [Pseudomonadota bacterium]